MSDIKIVSLIIDKKMMYQKGTSRNATVISQGKLTDLQSKHNISNATITT